MVGVSQVDRDVSEKVLDDLSADERAWLEERLETYRELLDYLHEN